MKQRIFYVAITLIMGFLALLTRTDIVLPHLIKVYGGDTLWAVMCYFLICSISPNTAGVSNLLLALILSFGVESSQLYQADWIKNVRSNRLGGLLLGHGFKVSDLVCYTLGNVSAFFVDYIVRTKKIFNTQSVK